ncbi:MAG: hypothetical protein V3U64_03575 [Cocleimonas sp.]
MITTNPFADLSALISPETMKIYVVLMVLFVIGGTILDMMHKKSAKYFFEQTKDAKKNAKREVGSGERKALLAKTITSEVLTSSEFSNPARRASHLLTMYGFILFVVTTAIMIFAYSGADSKGDGTPAILPILWHLGALMLAIGGYWFWFAIRVDVSVEGKKWYKLARTDLFIVSLLAMSTFALIWSFTSSMLFLALFILSSTILFTTVLWSKFAHMFFKPAAAYQKKIFEADGSREGLPEIPDLTDPEIQKKFPDIPTYMGEKPAYMGHGIRREKPGHF